MREVDGVPHINHPNFEWALPQEILLEVKNDRLLEIHNGHPRVHNEGGGGTPGMELVWDYLLTNGKRIFGIAVDDAHHFKGEFARDRANPGRGWVSVRATSLDAEEILANLEAGLFYASTGVELEDVIVSETRLEVRVRPRDDFRYTTEYIGDGGRVLLTSTANVSSLEVAQLDASVTYVRAKVTDSMGYVAWVQPVWVGDGAR